MLDYGTTSIRLVQVNLLLSADGLIQCNISQQKLPDPYQDGATGKIEYIAMGSEDSNGEHHSYMCLSYAWGDPQNHRTIRVNGKSFKVRRSLWKFLNIARHTLYDTFLWIDALCIDQENTSERNHQVQQMGRIYSGAETVLTWLGDDTEIESILRVVNQAQRQSELAYDWDRPTKLWNTRARSLTRDHPSLATEPTSPISSAIQPEKLRSYLKSYRRTNTGQEHG